jgi:DNA-binding SARP family transcriptional activator/tetratricopeptide (TPR) repeat protein
MLAWLALEGPTPRVRLAQLLWPDSPADAARNSLRQRLFHLKKALQVELVQGQALLTLAADTVHDLVDAGTVLADVDVEAQGELAAWLLQRRERGGALTKQKLMDQAQSAEERRDWVGALDLAHHLVALEPSSEAAHCRLMRLHYLSGDRAAALRAFDRCERVLRQELGVAPSADTLALRATIVSASSAAHALTARSVPVAVLRPPRLIGRQMELQHFEQGWRAHHVVAITGEAGMGKTRLMQDFAQARSGVLHVSARPGDAGVPLATLARLLRAVSNAQSVMAESTNSPVAQSAESWPAALVAASDAHAHGLGGAVDQRLRLQRDVARRLGAQQAVSGLLLDDLHFADGASLDLILALVDDSDSDLHWALAWRSADAGSPLHALADALASRARLHAVVLRPLDEAALADLVDSLNLPGLVGAQLAPALRQRTGGNPLFVLETLKLMWMEPGNGLGRDLLPRPASVTHLIERRLAQLSPGAMALARCAAVAGSEFSTALAAQVLGVSPLALADAWQELEAAQVLREEAFVHDLLYEATLASVPTPIARLLHGSIALHLHQAGGVAPSTLARHWLSAGRPDSARQHLELAALAATQALDVREAGRLWLQLAQLQEAAGLRTLAFEAAAKAVQALREHTTGADLSAAIDRLAELATSPEQRAGAERRRAEMLLTRGDTTQAAMAVEKALQLLGQEGDATDRSDLLNLQGVLLRRAGRLDEARRSLEAALHLARVHDAAQGLNGAPNDLPGVLNNLGLVLQAQDLHPEAIGCLQESAERQTDPATRARVLNNLAISLEERGQVQLAREQRLAAARAVVGSGSVVELMLAISLGAVARHLCRFGEALQHLERARVLGQGQQHFRQEDLLRQQAAIWLELGRFNLAREALDGASGLANVKADFALMDLLRARCLLAQGTGQHEQVLALLAPAEDLLRSSGDRRSLRRLWLLKARAMPPHEAVALLQTELAVPSVASNPGAALPMQVRLAQCMLAVGELGQSRRLAERSTDWMAAVQPLEVTPAEVWLTLAQAAQAQGDEKAAQAAVEQGLAFVTEVAQLHLEPMYREGWTHRNAVNRELARLGARIRRSAA